MVQAGDSPQVDACPSGAEVPRELELRREGRSHEQRLERILQRGALEELPETDFCRCAGIMKAAAQRAGHAAPRSTPADLHRGSAHALCAWALRRVGGTSDSVSGEHLQGRAMRPAAAPAQARRPRGPHQTLPSTPDTPAACPMPRVHAQYPGIAFSRLENVQKHRHPQKVIIKITPLKSKKKKKFKN